MAGFDHTVKLILLGDFIVNKKILLKALREWPADPEASCLNPGNGMVEMLFIRDGKRVRVKITDTGGQERFRSITSSFYRGVHGCLLLFDVNKKSTFDSLQEWLRELNTNTIMNDVEVILGGCNEDAGAQRQVAKRNAQNLAEHLRVPYRELSVKDVDTIVQVLEELVDRILLKASRVPEISTSIKPLQQRLQDLREEDESKAKQKTCAC